MGLCPSALLVGSEGVPPPFLPRKGSVLYMLDDEPVIGVPHTIRTCLRGKQRRETLPSLLSPIKERCCKWQEQ